MIRKILLTGLLALCGGVMAASAPPTIGSTSAGLMTVAQEQEYGQLFMRAVRQQLPLVHDLVVLDYIDTLGYQLASNSPKPSYPFHFFVVNDAQINAFAGPGGHIGINSGLILAVGSEDELAAVMAHEIGHVVQRHFARGVAQQQSLQLPAIAAMIAAIAVSMKAPQAGMGAMTATQAGMAQVGLRHSRQFEEEADNVGLDILKKSGFSTVGMTNMLKQLMSQHSISESEKDILAPLMSHPSAAQRAAESMNIFAKPSNDSSADQQRFQLMQIRLAVDTSNSTQELINNDQALLKNPQQRDNALLQYGYALALLKAGNTQQAEGIIAKVVAAHPSELLYQIAQARILLANKKSQASLTLLENLYQNNSDYFPLIILYANALIENDHAKKALAILDSYRGEFDDNPTYLAILATAQHKAGNTSESNLTLAKLYVMTGQLAKARAVLEIATKQSTDPITQAKISRALSDVEKQLKASKKQSL